MTRTSTFVLNMSSLKGILNWRKLPQPRKFGYRPRYSGKTSRSSSAPDSPTGEAPRLSFREAARHQMISERYEANHNDRMFYARVQHQKAVANLRFFIILFLLLLVVVWAGLKLL